MLKCKRGKYSYQKGLNMKRIICFITFFVGLVVLIFVVKIKMIPSNDTQEALSTHNKVTLHIMHWNTLPQTIIDKFEAENPNISIYYELNYVDDFIHLLENRLANKNVPDIIGAQENTFSKYVQEEVFMDLTDEVSLDHYQDAAIDELKALSPDGRIYSIPTNAFCLGVWINRDLFDEYDVPIPTTTEELESAAKQFSDKDIPPFVEGVKDGWPIIQTLFPMFDVQMMNKDVYEKIATGKLNWNDEPVRSGFLKWSDLYGDNFTEDSCDLTYAQTWQSFVLGNVPMWPMGSWANQLLERENSTVTDVGFNLDFIPIRSMDQNGNYAVPGTYIGAMYAISSTTKHPKEAKKFIEFITRPDIAIEFSNSSCIIPIKNLSSSEIPPYTSIVIKAIQNNSLVKPFNMSLDVRVNDQLTTSLQRVAAGSDMDTELNALQSVQDQVNHENKKKE